MTHTCTDILVELNKLYPSGLVLGDAKAIVGDLGLVIEWTNQYGNVFRESFKANTEIPISEIKGEYFHFGEFVPKAVIHYRYFKGFKIKCK